MRVVVDAYVLISAYQFPGGNPEAVFRLILNGTVELVTTRPLLAEFGRVLESKFGWDPPRSEEAVAQVARLATVVAPEEDLSIISQDPADDRVLETAVAGSAAYIVSGDGHLQQLGAFRGTRIVNPTTFLKSI